MIQVTVTIIDQRKIISVSYIFLGNESGRNCIDVSANVPFIISLYDSKTQKSSNFINKNVIFENSETNYLKLKKISLILFKTEY